MSPEDQKTPTLLGKTREVLRLKHYSKKTEETYIHWIKHYLRFFRMKHPRELSSDDAQAFLVHLATTRNVSASTQNQALSALLFLYREVLQLEISIRFEIHGAKRSKTVPTVLTKDEVSRVISQMSGMCALMAKLLYGSGMRLNECVQLRVKDIDFGQLQIIVHDGKGEQDRVTVLPEKLVPVLRERLQWRKKIHEEDLAHGNGSVYLPYALERKYPNLHPRPQPRRPRRQKPAG